MFKTLLLVLCFAASYMIRDPVAPDFVKNVLNVSVKAFWNCGVNVAATNVANANTMITETMILP